MLYLIETTLVMDRHSFVYKLLLAISLIIVLGCKREDPATMLPTELPKQENPPCRIRFLEHSYGTETYFEEIFYDSIGIKRVNKFGFGTSSLHFHYDSPLVFKCYFLHANSSGDTTGKEHIEVEKLPNNRLLRISNPSEQRTKFFTHHPNDSVYVTSYGQPNVVSYFDARGNETYRKSVTTTYGQLKIAETFMTYDNSANPFKLLGHDYWLYLGQNNNNLQKMTYKVNDSIIMEQHFELKYDNLGRLISMTDTLSNNERIRIISYYPCP